MKQPVQMQIENPSMRHDAVQGEGGAAQGEAQVWAGVGAGERAQGEGGAAQARVGAGASARGAGRGAGVGWSGSRHAWHRARCRRGLERELAHTTQGKVSGLGAL
jgi:hypothetical protein